jgi:hydrogenase maturation protease
MIAGHHLRKGDRVRLRPHEGADIFDLALAGRTGTIDSIEEDFDGKLHVAILIDDDPGLSLGPRRPGHRWFFKTDEVELLDGGVPIADARAREGILVAGIGNIFMGDDAFGVEVVHKLARRGVPADGVRVSDFGIRGYDLALALLDRPERTILVDACPRGDLPGTVYVVEPDLENLDDEDGAIPFDAHTMNPLNVLRLARAMGAKLENIVLVGCEPSTFGPAEGQLGLSEPVSAAVDRAIDVIDSLIEKYGGNGDSDAERAESPRSGRQLPDGFRNNART